MAIYLDYYYNDNSKEQEPILDIQKVINGERDFLGCFIMTVNGKYVLNDYNTYPENKVYADKDWITWIGIQLMESLIAFENNNSIYAYIHFIEYSGGKGLEIFLKDSNVIINYVSSGIEWYSFDKKKDNLKYYWSNEVVSFVEYKKAIQTYCEKIYGEYHKWGESIKDILYPEFENNYKKLFLSSQKNSIFYLEENR